MDWNYNSTEFPGNNCLSITLIAALPADVTKQHGSGTRKYQGMKTCTLDLLFISMANVMVERQLI